MEGHHEPIISREEFEAAERMLSQRAEEKKVNPGDKKYNRKYPFTKKIICGECGSAFKRRINSAGTIKYPAWVCREHIEHKENCSIKFVREDALEDAFCTMMNKLIFGRERILRELSDAISNQNHRDGLLRIREIESELDGMAERKQNLTSILTKGFIDPAAYSQEINNIMAEETSLEEERSRIKTEIGGDMKKTEALQELIRFTGRSEMINTFEAELFDRFTDHITIRSRKEAVFHLRCGLSLRERIE